MRGVKNLDELLERLWHDYAGRTPQAPRIHALLEGRGERVVNDHIALRTFDDPRVGIDALAPAFTRFGYAEAGGYEFAAKKLRARHYEHPDARMPKVFISELKTGECSASLRRIVAELLGRVDGDAALGPGFAVSGRPWDVSHAIFEELAGESEYAGWMAAHGFRANHFTVAVHELATFGGLAELNDFLKTSGFTLNTSGGEIKGTPGMGLEQSSTLASEIEVGFSDGAFVVPGCYYEFAMRHRCADGKLFSGFVAQSADRIFESTDRRPGAKGG